MSRERPPRNVISLVGPSGSGKTEIICRLVQWLTARGLRVGVLKHSHHLRPAVTPEAEVYRQGGVRVFARPAPGAVEIYGFPEGEPEPGPLVARLAAQVDLLLVEGYKTGELPKILLTGPGVEEVLPGRQGVVALISREAAGGELPVFRPDEVEAVGHFVLAYLKGRQGSPGGPPPPPGPADGPGRPG
ncbi:MAG: molybdopterin-guanine dinucleotide biosynthesis protein MobB [Syntrophobacterales bacterium]|nr:molybdopterin-guanine dinucleotide biosynthesis protein MobB [Syntrophobacterales bacterium]